MNIDCSPLARLKLFQPVCQLTRLFQVYWTLLYSLGPFVQRGFLRRSCGFFRPILTILLTLLINGLSILPQTALAAITSPTSVSPANNAQINTTSVTFTWSHPYTTDLYAVKIKDSSGRFKIESNKVSSKSLTIDLSSLSLTYGSTYKWYVVVYANGLEASSEDRYFTYKADPTAPVVGSFTVNNTAVKLGESFTFNYSVSDSGGSNLQKAELWRSTDGSVGNFSPVSGQVNFHSGPSATGTFTDTPGNAGTYWYGMHVIDNASPNNVGFETSSQRKQVTVTQITKPILVSPLNNANITTASTTFSWSHPFNDQYELIIKDPVTGSIVHQSGYVSAKTSTVNGMGLSSGQALVYGKQYKWYVVVKVNGLTDSSVDQYFTFNADSTAPVVGSFTVNTTSVPFGGAFTFNYSVSDSGGSNLKQTELWRSIDGTNFSPVAGKVNSHSGTSATGTFTDSPGTAGTYWYGMHVVDNAGNWSAETSTQKKQVTVTQITKPTLDSPADNASITTASTTFSWSHPYNDQYELIIKDPVTGSIVHQTGYISAKTSTVNGMSLSTSQTLVYGKQYKWYVVVKVNGLTDSSVDRYFTYKVDPTGRVNVSDGVSVTPAAVTVGQNFTVSFNLKEFQGGSKGFEYVELWIQSGTGAYLYMAQRWSAVSFSANQQQSFSTSTFLDPAKGRGTGTYQAMVKGKVAGDVPFNFGVVSGSGGVNPKSFSAEPCTLSGTVSGSVIDATNNKPQSGIRVVLGASSTTSGSNGSFSFASVSAGLHTLTASVAGFASGGVPVNVCGDTTQDIQLTRNQTVYGPTAPSGYAADPVNTATGNYTFNRTDLKLPGKGLGFAFERGYNSLDPSNGPLGFGWTHSYNTSLSVDGSGNVTVRYGDGHTVTFASNGSGGYTAQYGVFDTLVKEIDASYTVTQKDQSVYGFSSSGTLMSIADRNGNTLALIYSGAMLARVTDTAGRNIDFSYDAQARITQLADPLGRTVQFTYDGAGNLVTSTDPAGKVTSYGYDANHQMLSATDPRGNVFVTNTYDADLRVVSSQRDAKGGQTTYAYDPVTRQTTITDALAQVSMHTHDSLLRLIKDQDPLGHSQLYAYDSAGNRTSVTDRNGKVTAYEYDTRGNVTKKTDALANVTTITYDAYNNPLTRTDALGKITSFAYDTHSNLTASTDALGHSVSSTYDSAGLPLTLTDARGNVTTNTFDASGNLSQIRDALTNVTRFTYDAAGRHLTRTDALGRITAYAYDADDNLVSVTDPVGKTTLASYDGNNNRISSTDKLGRITTIAYDQKDLPTSVTNALGGVSSSTYDALDHKLTSTDRRGNLAQYAYDATGRLTSSTDALGNQTQYAYDAQGNRTSVTDALGHVSNFSYDAMNRLTQASDALGNSSSTTFDTVGRVSCSTNAKGQTTSFANDDVGRLILVSDAAGGTVSYAYDAAGNRTSMTDPKGNSTSYAYDALNRLTTKTEPGGYITQVAYDAVGNRSTLTKPDGSVIRYAYDNLDRLSTITYADSSQVSFTYDANGNRKTMLDGLGSSTYTYDALDRLINTVNPFGKTVGYSYDAAGNLATLTYPDGKQVSYAYDALNRMTSLRDWASRSTSYAYDLAGRLTASNLANGTQASYGFDSADRLTALSHGAPATPPAAPVAFASYAYTLDALGNQTGVTAVDPIARALTSSSASYSYDTDNRLTQINATEQSFDANGNQTAKGADVFAWDQEDRLRQSTTAGASISYQYDGTGNRLSRAAGGNTTRFVLDVNAALSRVLAETDNAGSISAWYVYGLGLVERVAADASVRFYHHDSRGSTVALTDAAGAVTDKYAYDPFGQVVNSSGTTPNPYKYVGRFGLFDEGNGLIHVRARYYNPAQGRFISKDPKPGSDTDSQSLNRFIYALNNPVRLVDVSGLSPKDTTSKNNSPIRDDVAVLLQDAPKNESPILDIFVDATMSLFSIFFDAANDTHVSEVVSLANKVAAAKACNDAVKKASEETPQNVQNNIEILTNPNSSEVDFRRAEQPSNFYRDLYLRPATQIIKACKGLI